MFDYDNMNIWFQVLIYTSTVLCTVFCIFAVGRFFCLDICEDIDRELFDEFGWGMMTVMCLITASWWASWFFEIDMLVFLITIPLAFFTLMLAIGVVVLSWVLLTKELQKLHNKIHDRKYRG